MCKWHPHKQEKQKGRRESKEASQNTGRQESLSRKNEKKAKPFAAPALEETVTSADTPGNSEKQHRTSVTSPEWSPGLCLKGSQAPVEGVLAWSSGGVSTLGQAGRTDHGSRGRSVLPV